MSLVYAAAGSGGVQARQATGVFANEAGPFGWSQPIDSVNLHPPPLAHEPSAAPHPRSTSQSRPPAMLQSQRPSDDHQQETPLIAAHTQPPLQQPGLPAAAPEAFAQREATQHGLEFQYDSFSDSMGDELMPEAPLQGPYRPDDSHIRSAADEAARAAQQGIVDSPAPGEQGQGEQKQQQHEQQEVDEQHEQHSSQPAVLPQTDGAGDSDSVNSQDVSEQCAAAKLLCTQQQNSNSRPPCLTDALPKQPPAEGTLQAEDLGPGQHAAAAQQQGQLVVADSAAATVVVQRSRRRRSRHVVQHAVRLAAAARDAMDSVVALQDAGSAPIPQGNAPGRQPEPQLPSWLRPQAAAHRTEFQSEPQLPRSLMTFGSGLSSAGLQPPGSSAWQGQGQVQGQGPAQGQGQGQEQGQGQHHLRQDSQYGEMGRPGNVIHHHASQSTVAAAPPSSSALVPSQIVSDSRATSDLQWQQRHQHRMISTLQQSQRIESQVVSDSRATSDLQWAQHRQTWQASLEQQTGPSQDSTKRHSVAAAHGHELAWEQPASAQANTVSEACRAAVEAASVAAAGVAGSADDLEVVVSDSQPSPVQQQGRSVYPSHATVPPYPSLLLSFPPGTPCSAFLIQRAYVGLAQLDLIMSFS